MRRFARTAGLWVWGVTKALYQRSIYAAAFVAFLLLSWSLITAAYYSLPGSWFLHYYDVEMTPAVAGDDVPMTLCRTRRYGDIKAHLTRTFYKADETRGVQLTFRSQGGYQEDITVEDGPDCQALVIPAQRFRHTAGKWKFHADLVFDVDGRRKVTSYNSPVYAITERPTNAQLQDQLTDKIKALQRQLDELKRQVGYVPPAPAASSPATARNEDVTTSAPPEPPQGPQRAAVTTTRPEAKQPSQTTPQPNVVLLSPVELLNTLGGE